MFLRIILYFICHYLLTGVLQNFANVVISRVMSSSLYSLSAAAYPASVKGRYLLDPGGGGTPYNGLYGKTRPERGTFFTLQVYERVGISRVEVYERVGKSVI